VVKVAKYFRCELNYGHQKSGKRLESARYLRMESHASYIDVMDTVMGMPGVKKGIKAFNEIVEISKKEYLRGKKKEEEDIWLKQLKSFSKSH
jgi:hypothetical protein